MADEQDEDQSKEPGFAQIVLSTLAAGIGVQNQKNLERDFKSKSIFPYIVAGIVFTALFLLTLIFIVSLVV